MTINKILLAMALGLALVACAEKGSYVPTVPSVGGANFNVQKLFTTDGCTVYRFHDSGRNHYFTNCTATVSQYTESCGKSCTTTKSREIPTNHVTEPTADTSSWENN
jgi:hypothetical protein